MSDQYNLYYKLQLPIPFYNVCQINQPTLKEIMLEMGMTKFENLLFPFCVTVDAIQDLSNEEKQKIKNFDILLSNPELAASLCQSLEYFCRSEIKFNDGQIYFGEFSGGLNRDNFDEFAEVVLEMCARKRPEDESKKFKTEKAKEIWRKIQAGRARDAQKNQFKIEDVINVCQYGGSCHISIDEIMKFTIWELMNCYKCIVSISNYKDAFSVYIQTGDKNLITTNWVDSIKIK